MRRMPPGGRTRRTRRAQSQSEERPLRDLWRWLIAYDVDLVWKLQGAVRAWPLCVRNSLAHVISHHPLRDISVVTWFAFLLGCRQFGFHFFWACCFNLTAAGILRLLLAAPRPFMYDQRLRPLTDQYHSSYGVPSLETHMATVIAGWWAEAGGGSGSENGSLGGGQPLARLAAMSYVALVGFTRVYACSRFVHQVCASFVSGLVGLSMGWWLSDHLGGLRLTVKHHVRGAVVVTIIALGVVAHQIENNESQLVGVRKKEYLRVLTNIMDDSRQAQSALVGAPGSEEGGDSVWEMERDAPWDGRATSPRTSIRKTRRADERRDSFHFLQKSAERRASKQASSLRPHYDSNFSHTTLGTASTARDIIAANNDDTSIEHAKRYTQRDR